MKLSSRLATAAAVLVAGLGVSTSSASAYAMTTHLTGSSFSQHTVTFDSAYTVSCDASLTGTSSGASIAFGFSYSNCTYFGFPASIYTSGSWGLQTTGGSAPNFTGQITVPSAAAMTLDVPIVGCEVYFTTPQSLSHGSGGNAITMTNVVSPTSVDLGASLKLPYTSNGGCMFSVAGTAEYETNGPVRIPDLTIDN